MGIWDRMFREMFEDKAGRIRFTSGGWSFNPSQSLLNKTFRRNPNFYGGKPHVRKDADDKDMTLVSQRSAICFNPEIGQNTYPRYKSGWYCVPAFVCQKCQYHKKADRRGRCRFSRCLFRTSQDPGVEAFKETMECFGNAIKETNKILSRE